MDVQGLLATLVAAVVMLFVPGLSLVLVLRLRAVTALAVAAPASLVMIAVSAEVGHLLPIPWTPVSPLLLGLLAGAAAWPLGRRLAADRARADGAVDGPDPAAADGVLGRLAASRPGRGLAIGAGLVIGAVVILVQALSMMGSVRAVTQTYDGVFHLNAVRHILRHGDGSAWVVGGMTSLPGQGGYYPAAWHQLVSLVVELSGQGVVLSSNVTMLLLAAVVWPLGLLALVRSSTSAGPVGWMIAGALAGVTGAFPLSMMSWGLVLPYFLSMTMMPLVMMVVAHVTRMAPASPRRLLPGQLAVLLPVVCLAVGAAHPQGVFVGIVLGVPMLVWATAARGREHLRGTTGRGTGFWPLLVLTVGVIGASALAWGTLRPSRGASFWGPTATVKQAVGQTFTLAPNESPTFVPMGLVLLVAVVAVLWGSRSRWLLAPWLAASVMSVAARSAPFGELRYQLTGIWYNDGFRVTAMLAVAAIPLLAVGGDVVAREAVRRLPSLRGRVGPLAVLAVTLAVLALSLVSPSNRTNASFLAVDWQHPDLLTADEREVLERLPDHVPPDAVIATNALNGSALAYAISDRAVLNRYMSFEAVPEVHLLNHALDEARTDPEVCDAVQELGVEYALDFGPVEVGPGYATYLGLNEISETGAAEVVLQVGDAALLQMRPCRGTDGELSR